MNKQKLNFINGGIKMNSKKFIDTLLNEIENNADSFIENMKNYNEGNNNNTFCHWVEIFVAWMEWEHGDCEDSYGDDYEEEEL